MAMCFSCEVDGVETAALVIPERSNVRVCQRHYDAINMGLLILEGDLEQKINHRALLLLAELHCFGIEVELVDGVLHYIGDMTRLPAELSGEVDAYHVGIAELVIASMAGELHEF